jgi:hypothetical protein
MTLQVHSSLYSKRVKVKVKQSHYRPGQALKVPGGWGSQISKQSAHKGVKVVRPTHRRLYPQETFLGLNQPEGHSAAGRIMSMKNSNDTIGNRTHELPACSAVPQPTVPPRAPSLYSKESKLRNTLGRMVLERTPYIDVLTSFKVTKPRQW